VDRSPLADVAIENLSVTFARKERVQALVDINLAIHEGEFVTIVGPSGCGKTTLLRVIAGLEKPTSGRVVMYGKTITKPGPDRAYVFQNDNLLPWRTALDNVALSLQVTGLDMKKARKISKQLIDLVGLTGFEACYPSELSGGMRQRVNIARGLAVDPRLLLMDEPFASLDALTRDHMQQELLNIWDRTKKTVLFITHDVDEAIYLSDRVYVFSSHPGRVAAEIRVDIPRPRPIEVKGTPAFAALVDETYGVLRRVWQLRDQLPAA
jgi:NitT/TauT family transport system ATP-binding protein